LRRHSKTESILPLEEVERNDQKEGKGKASWVRVKRKEPGSSGQGSEKSGTFSTSLESLAGTQAMMRPREYTGKEEERGLRQQKKKSDVSSRNKETGSERHGERLSKKKKVGGGCPMWPEKVVQMLLRKGRTKHPERLGCNLCLEGKK